MTMPRTLNELLDRAAEVSDRGYTFLNGDLEPREWSFRDLAQEAERRGKVFLRLGLKPGDRLALILPDGEDFVLSFLGAIRVGIIPVPMYPPLSLGKLDSYIETAKRILMSSGAKLLLTSKQVSSLLWSLVSKVSSLEDLITAEKFSTVNVSSFAQEKPDVGPHSTCFLQFTSGSTSDPKGVMVSHANLLANAKAIMIDGLDAHGYKGDRGVSWLPLYHDMGLIGFVIAPLLTMVPVVFIPTVTFVKAQMFGWIPSQNIAER